MVLVLTNKQERLSLKLGYVTFIRWSFLFLKQASKSKSRIYRDYKRFDNEKFRESLITYFSTVKNISYDAFENLVLHTLDKMAPIKQKHIRGNQSPFLNKYIHKAIMTITRLRNRFLKEPTPMNRLACKKQRNYRVSLLHENKRWR